MSKLLTRPTLLFSICLGLYALVRLILLPADVFSTGAFSHDSGYLSIVARNLAEGRGFVNEARWLMFAVGDSLPMPYHNANPLYPVLMAGLMRCTSLTAERAGLVVSLLGQVLLMAGVYGWTRAIGWRAALAAAAALAAGLYPANWADSLMVLPDALATGLSFITLALAARASGPAGWAAAGAVFGLCWLTRSTALLGLPGLALWWWTRSSFRQATVAMVVFLGAAGVVASPWLWHTAQVRGGALRSDATYYWFQEVYAERAGISVEQYWRSLTEPPPASQVIAANPGGIARRFLTGTPKVLYYYQVGLSAGNRLAMLALDAALCLALCLLWRKWLSWGYGMMAVTIVVSVVMLALRASSMEVRYLGLMSTFLAVALVAPLAEDRPGRRWLWVPALLALLAALPLNTASAQRALAVQPHKLQFREAATAVARRAGPGVAVVTEYPYFYSYLTARQSISPPFPGKTELLDQMRRFHAVYLFSEPVRLGELYPGAPASLAPELQPLEGVGSFVLLGKPSALD